MSNKKQPSHKALLSTIRKLEKESQKLKKENQMLREAWTRTEEYLAAISEDKTIDEIFNEIDTKTTLRKVKKKCPNCSSSHMHQRQYTGFKIISCSRCEYRNRMNDEN